LRRIKAEISLAGKLRLEFVGFAEEACEEERERLRKILVESGVALRPEKIIKKSATQILEEMATNKKESEPRHGRQQYEA